MLLGSIGNASGANGTDGGLAIRQGRIMAGGSAGGDLDLSKARWQVGDLFQIQTQLWDVEGGEDVRLGQAPSAEVGGPVPRSLSFVSWTQ